jgi:hypothetical protein
VTGRRPRYDGLTKGLAKRDTASGFAFALAG